MTEQAPQRTADRGDVGTITVSVTFAVAFAMVLFVQLANIAVFVYGRSVVESALDEAARAGQNGDMAACATRADDVLEDLLAGMRDGVTVTCTDVGDYVEVVAVVNFDGWLTSIGDYDGTLRASAAKQDR
jgi:hypothetical protein